MFNRNKRFILLLVRIIMLLICFAVLYIQFPGRVPLQCFWAMLCICSVCWTLGNSHAEYFHRQKYNGLLEQVDGFQKEFNDKFNSQAQNKTK